MFATLPIRAGTPIIEFKGRVIPWEEGAVMLLRGANHVIKFDAKYDMDARVTFDKLEPRGGRTAFHWTLTGTYAGTGNHVRISGYELWKIDNAGLIAESKGHFDNVDYKRQLTGK